MMNTLDIAHLVAKRGETTIPLTHYTGILLMHGMTRLAVLAEDDKYLAHVKEVLKPFADGERDFRSNFPNYECGGNGTAWLLYLGKYPEAAEVVRKYAEQIMNDAPRTEEGILTHVRDPEKGKIWIDVAFAVTPFMIFAGKALSNDAYIEEGYQQCKKMVDLFLNQETGLLHQSRGFNGVGNFSDDHWSRGNGWGIFALTELINYLPADDPRRAESERMFVDLLEACLKVQDENGMWHQEMTYPDSYVETSGTGLILYAIGVGIEKGLLGDKHRDALVKGLTGYTRYIALDGSVHNTCQGCLCPEDGSKEAYARRAWILNDCHAFGPVVLSFAQAWHIGIKEIELN